ncbi:MAG: SDR family oxidoreductase [Dehalococcoidia bacterium]|nr:SDR family oxidoreductase [Dehalococcoidia bacterium]
MIGKAHRGTRRILLAGGTGYVGGRLLRVLEASGRPLRCLARKPEFLRPRVATLTEVVRGDVLELPSLNEAMKDVHTAYYLVHSMAAGGGFEERDRMGAENFARAAREKGVKRIIYLGGLGGGERLSSHLASRQEVGEILRSSGVPTIEFRASIIIGSGSLSFEMVRALVEKLPVMTTPRWVRSQAQPIAVEDVTAYLSKALELEDDKSYVFEIGGADQVSYRTIMQEYARQRGLRRIMIPVPVLTPWLSSLWLGLVTPIYSRVGRQLIEGVRNDTVVEDDLAMRVFDLRPRGIQEAIARALSNEEQEFAETRWSDALSSRAPPGAWGGERFGSRIVDSATIAVSCEPAKAFAPIRRMGGKTGWYYADWLWRLRGLIDLLVGGAGMRRGRRSQESLVPGDTVDFWRVEAFEPDRLLRLLSEMRLPGRAWLQFEVEGEESGSVIRQTAMFDALGLPGLAYWYGLYPIHRAVFKGMLRGIAKAASVEE